MFLDEVYPKHALEARIREQLWSQEFPAGEWGAGEMGGGKGKQNSGTDKDIAGTARSQCSSDTGGCVHRPQSCPADGAWMLGSVNSPHYSHPIDYRWVLNGHPPPTSRSTKQASLRDETRNLLQQVRKEKSLASTEIRGEKQGRDSLRDNVHLSLRPLSSPLSPSPVVFQAMTGDRKTLWLTNAYVIFNCWKAIWETKESVDTPL